MSELVVPDYSEPIIGWRMWVRGYGINLEPYLKSLWGGARWPEREPMVARCMQVDTTHSHWMARWKLPKVCCAHSPRSGCKCGLYAVSDPSPVLQPSDDARFVVGRIALWGKVIRHERGYRAQYGYPLSIGLGESASKVPSRGWEVVERLANAYGCEIDFGPGMQQSFHF